MANAPQSKIAFRELSIGFAFGAIAIWALVTFIDKTPGKNSPIRVVGGSIKFKANDQHGWATGDCPNLVSTSPDTLPCLTSVNPINGLKVTLDGNATLSSLSSWKVFINVFSPDTTATQLATIVYPSDASGSCISGETYTAPGGQIIPLCKTQAGSTYITSQVVDTKKLFAPDSPYDKHNNKRTRRYRYRDTDCCNDKKNDYRESISDITVYYMKNGSQGSDAIKCGNTDTDDNGECSVYFGPVQ